MNTFKLVLSIVVVENLQLEKLDVKTTFLHSTTRGFQVATIDCCSTHLTFATKKSN